MTYRNRVSKRQNRKPQSFKIRCKEHKRPYLTKFFSDNIDPHNGKYIGWKDLHWKERGLKKRHRAHARMIIKELQQIHGEI